MRRGDILVTKCDGTQAIQQGKRRPVAAGLQRAVFARDGLCCRYCGVKKASVTDYEIDHVKPSRRGGLDELDNLVVACIKCNREKRDQIWTPLTVEQAWGPKSVRRPIVEKRKIASRKIKQQRRKSMQTTIRFD